MTSTTAPVVGTQQLSDQNPNINQAGQAIYGAGKSCTWTTNNGSTSTCVITNPGNQNTLTFMVSGAPTGIQTVDGKPFNGQWTLPPNQPTMNVTASGNFVGVTVTIFNISSPSTDCKVVALVA